MKMFLDFLPIVLFFAVYHFSGDILLATLVLIPATLLQVAFMWWRYRRVEKMQLVTLVLVVVMGGATVLFHNPAFIQWKPTVVNWLFALAFLLAPLFGGKTLVERMIGKAITLPAATWRRLNLAWALFFMALGALNVYVFKTYDEATWVNFKLFGMLGLTLLFVLGQGIYLARHMPRDTLSQNDQQKDDV
ncbi:intracellular septation protein A [Chromohalobacter marismortui]|uniref:Inner membrane-spanning protein YciB n=1 Tax=Chromohalobacter marismortui TaxID=42055 RepID=A0A4R7NTI7_9GAMM|nr:MULTISPECIES: septation protein A [Chromohalobacter]MCI0509186.1 septation protein A [Chromohalobacter sp.]MCI0593877.1 septation protein A [Chromohalobacter sp.]TDU23921.1 intracellular septation protein A [Chromohalobacter marismortui]